jgi:hypothetical protein
MKEIGLFEERVGNNSPISSNLIAQSITNIEPLSASVQFCQLDQRTIITIIFDSLHMAESFLYANHNSIYFTTLNLRESFTIPKYLINHTKSIRNIRNTSFIFRLFPVEGYPVTLREQEIKKTLEFLTP